MKLFRYEGYNITISEEALLLKPFKTLWDRDKSKDKYKAMQELGYIYFMEDPRSDYQTYIDKEERSKQIILGEGMAEGWTPDAKVKEAQEFYQGFKSAAALLLEDLRSSIQTLRLGLITQENLTEVEIDKRPKLLNDYASTIDRLLSLARKVDETEKNLAREIVQSDKVRGSAEKAMYEDM